MVIIITGATHTGKTKLAQALMESLHIPYVCQDHVKMGLIRTGCTSLTPEDDDRLTAYLWPVTREMIKTVIENDQSLIVEGCYVPFDWEKDFSEKYLKNIRFICLCFSEQYIRGHLKDIIANASCIEHRLDDEYCTQDLLIRENRRYLEGCKAHSLPHVLIDESNMKAVYHGEMIYENIFCQTRAD